MKDYSNPEPEFHNTIQIVDTSTPDNGDLISQADRQNHDNTVVNHEAIKGLEENKQDKKDALSKTGGTMIGNLAFEKGAALILGTTPSDIVGAIWIE